MEIRPCFVKQVWQAEDGKTFDSVEECEKHEEKLLNEKNKAEDVKEFFFGPDVSEEDKSLHSLFVASERQKLSDEKKLKLFKDHLPFLEIITNLYRPLEIEKLIELISEATSALDSRINMANDNEVNSFNDYVGPFIKNWIERYLNKTYCPFFKHREIFPTKSEFPFFTYYSLDKSLGASRKSIFDISKEESKPVHDYLYKYLSELQAKTFIYRYGLDGFEPRGLTGVGRIINLSRDRVRNLEKGAVFRLIKLEIYSIFLNDFYRRNMIQTK